jgi:hypothetical protein
LQSLFATCIDPFSWGFVTLFLFIFCLKLRGVPCDASAVAGSGENQESPNAARDVEQMFTVPSATMVHGVPVQGTRWARRALTALPVHT